MPEYVPNVLAKGRQFPDVLVFQQETYFELNVTPFELIID